MGEGDPSGFAILCTERLIKTGRSRPFFWAALTSVLLTAIWAVARADDFTQISTILQTITFDNSESFANAGNLNVALSNDTKGPSNGATSTNTNTGSFTGGTFTQSTQTDQSITLSNSVSVTKSGTVSATLSNDGNTE